jgi:hypothetical protein
MKLQDALLIFQNGRLIQMGRLNRYLSEFGKLLNLPLLNLRLPLHLQRRVRFQFQHGVTLSKDPIRGEQFAPARSADFSLCV